MLTISKQKHVLDMNGGRGHFGIKRTNFQDCVTGGTHINPNQYNTKFFVGNVYKNDFSGQYNE